MSAVAGVSLLLVGVSSLADAATTTTITSAPGITLTASQPLLRTGQSVTLFAKLAHPLTTGQELSIVDETTGQTIALTEQGSTLSASWVSNTAVTQNFQAKVTQTSKALPISWSSQGTGDNRGYANAAGGTVTLSTPATATANLPLTVTATPTGITHPVFQFWWAVSGGQWHDSGAYSASNSYTFKPPIGLIDIVAYARNGSAPSHEDASQRALYLAKSATETFPAFGNTTPPSSNPGSPASTNAWVGLQGLNQVSVGTSMQFTAGAVAIANPVYQFWFLSPNNQWESSGHYSLSNTFTLTASTPGAWEVMVYARPESAPINETTAERAATTVHSPTMPVTVHP